MFHLPCSLRAQTAYPGGPVGLQHLAPPGAWSTLGQGPSRLATTPHPLAAIDRPLAATWTRSTDADGNTISFIGQAPTAVSRDAVFAVGRVSPPGQPANQTRLFAFDRSTGAVRWWMPVASTVLDSDTGPVLDDRAGTVIFASQRFVTAFDQATGAQRWQAQLTRSVVNASPLVVNEPGRPGRLFITDYDGFSTAAKLYCINTAPLSPTNPRQPGAIVWSAPIGGSSGNSPAYLPSAMGGLGHVYVATLGAGGGGGNAGKIEAFDAFADVPSSIFTFENPHPEGFFGGLCVLPPARSREPPSLLAATYAFSGGLDAGNLVKVSARDGSLIWSTPCNRTMSIPVPLPGGRIALSTGIQGFGSLPAVELFQDLGSSGVLLWNSAVATWNDLNLNGFIDPGEHLAVGGWTQQPVASTFGGRTTLAVGLIPPSGTFSSPSHELFVLDLDAPPFSPAFVQAHTTGAGGSPAAPGAALISVGTAGLVHFGPTPAMLDLSQDFVVSTGDLYTWESSLSTAARDLDRDGQPTAADRSLLINALRAPESALLIGGRP